jgi:hypothetical protein
VSGLLGIKPFATNKSDKVLQITNGEGYGNFIIAVAVFIEIAFPCTLSVSQNRPGFGEWLMISPLSISQNPVGFGKCSCQRKMIASPLF